MSIVWHTPTCDWLGILCAVSKWQQTLDIQQKQQNTTFTQYFYPSYPRGICPFLPSVFTVQADERSLVQLLRWASSCRKMFKGCRVHNCLHTKEDAPYNSQWLFNRIFWCINTRAAHYRWCASEYPSTDPNCGMCARGYRTFPKFIIFRESALISHLTYY